jgi:hypothetical protein
MCAGARAVAVRGRVPAIIPKRVDVSGAMDEHALRIEP